MRDNKIEQSGGRRGPLVVAAVVVVALMLVAGAVGFGKLRDIYLEQCVITDMAEQVSITSGKMVKADVIAENLGLRKGVNCISVIIEGADFIDEGNHGTMDCVAPCIDYMEIKTDAQLGFFGQFDNGFGRNGLSIVI